MSCLSFLSSAGASAISWNCAVDLEPLEAALHVVGDLLAVLALPPAHHRRGQVEARALRQGEHAVDHLAHRLALDRQAGRGRIGDADARPQKAHVVVDLGHRAHRRARVLRRRLLLDGDRRRQAVDLVDVRLLHHLEELPGVGREQLDVAPLPFRVDRVEGERRLARAGQAGEHHQPVARDGEVDVLEIVLARAAHDDRPAAEQSLDVRVMAPAAATAPAGFWAWRWPCGPRPQFSSFGARIALARNRPPMLEQKKNKGKAPRAPRLGFALM